MMNSVIAAVIAFALALVFVSSAGAASTATAPCKTIEVVAGPFDIHRRYRSMEGPYVMGKIKISDLLFSKRTEFPESMVVFLEGSGRPPAGCTPAHTHVQTKNSILA